MKRITSRTIPNLPDSIILYLGQTSECPAEVESFLSRAEIDKYRSIKSRHRALEFITGRWLLQSLMGEQGFERGDWQIEYGSSGKPWIKMRQMEAGSSQIPIGIAHTYHAVLAGISFDTSFGVDIESKDRVAHTTLKERIVRYEPLEKTREESAIRVWSIKEAVLKLCGDGLRLGMDKVTIIKWYSWGCRVSMNGKRDAVVASCIVEGFWIAVAWYSEPE